MNPSTDNSTAPPRPPTLLLWATFVLVGVAFFGAEHFPFIVHPVGRQMKGSEIGAFTSHGSLIRQLSFSSLGLFGLFCMVGSSRRRFGVNSMSAVLLLFFLLWCFASIFWTTDLSLTTRRLGVLALCFLGALGISRKWTARDLCVFTLSATLVYLLVGVGEELVLGTFAPLSSRYRFAGVVHPNTQACYCAFMCVAAICLARGATYGRGLLIALFLAGALLLVLTKSRGCFGALVVALFALWFMRASANARVLAVLMLPCVICAAAMWFLLFPTDPGDVQGQLVSAALLGRTKYAASVGGRMPVWAELLTHIQARPLLGYGYDAFWTPRRIQALSAIAFWGVGEAHSAYLEITLSVGLVGSSALALAVAISLCRSGRLYSASGDAGDGLVFAVLVFAVVYGVVESPIVVPTFIAFVVACGLLLLEFRREDNA